MNITKFGTVHDIQDFDVFSLPHVNLSSKPQEIAYLEKVHAVYFVVDNGELVYIGKSRNLKGRITDHRYNMFKDKRGCVYYLELKPEFLIPFRLVHVENTFIAHFQPKLNISHNPKYQTKQE